MDMPENLNSRQKKLLAYMLNASDYTSLEKLAQVGNCSTKTVSRDLKQLQEMASAYGFLLTKKSKEGIRLEANDETRDQLNYELKSSRITLDGESVWHRRHQIYLDLLMNAPKPTTIQKLSEQYYVGKSSIVNDLARIEEVAKCAGLAMIRTRNGTSITGKERLIRNEIAAQMKITRSSAGNWESPGISRLDEETCQVLKLTFGEREVNLVAHAIEAIEMQMGYLMGDIYYINVITHMLIAGQRIRSGQYITEENLMLGQEFDHDIYSIIAFEVRKLGGFLEITYPEAEILFLYTHFTSTGYGELPAKERLGSALAQVDENTVSFCRTLMQGIEEQTQTVLGTDKGVLDSLILHMKAMMNRIRYDVRITCPLKEQIVQEFSETYLLVRNELLRMKKSFFPDYYIPEDEICYLCLYFQSLLEAESRRKRILVVCSTGVGTSHLVRKRIECSFPDLEIVDVISIKRLMNRDLTGIDFVVSTVKLQKELPVPVVIVSILMDQKDSQAISKAIIRSARKETKKNMNIRSVLSPENVKLELHGRTKDEVLQEMTELLFQNGCVTDREAFIKALYLREEEGITGIGEGIAIPHGKSSVVAKTAIAIGRNLDGIEWETFDDKPVRVVIMFAVRDVDMSQHIMLLSRVAELLCDGDVTAALFETKDTGEIIQILGREGSK